MGKDIYLAGKIDNDEVCIDAFSAELEARGHQVIEKWWEQGRLPTPYMDHIDTSGPAAKAMINAARGSDVCILFPDDRILGAAVEYGAAVASMEYDDDKVVVVVNPWDVRQSVFYAHPDVVAVRGLAEIREMDWY